MKALSFLANPLNLLASRVAYLFADDTDVLTVNNKSVETSRETAKGLTVWTGEVSRNWHDPQNWSLGLPNQKRHAYIPTYPSGDQFPTINQEMTINYTIKNDGLIKNKGEITVMPNGIIQNYGIFENKGDAKLTNKGNWINAGALMNTGFINNQNIFSNGKMVDNSGTFLGEDRIINMKAINKEGMIDGLNMDQLKKTSDHLTHIYGF